MVSQMGFNTDWSHTWAATTVRNCESLMQVQMRYVAAHITRFGQTHHCVHVGAINIYLAAFLMNQITDITNLLFEYTVSRWVGNHDARQISFMLFSFCTQIINIDVTLLIT